MATIFLGLGANLGEPKAQFEAALQLLAKSTVTVTAASRLFRSAPMGPQDQPDFYNAVVAAQTELAPSDLLAVTQRIETTLGRVKTRHWGERSIDIDILLYNDDIVARPNLSIPHPGLKDRNFVLQPLLDLVPESFTLPSGESLGELAEAAGWTGLTATDQQLTVRNIANNKDNQ